MLKYISTFVFCLSVLGVVAAAGGDKDSRFPRLPTYTAICVADCGPCVTSSGTVEPSNVTAITYEFYKKRLLSQSEDDFECVYNLPGSQPTYSLHFGRDVNDPGDIAILEAMAGTQKIGVKPVECEVSLSIACSSLTPSERTRSIPRRQRVSKRRLD